MAHPAERKRPGKEGIGFPTWKPRFTHGTAVHEAGIGTSGVEAAHAPSTPRRTEPSPPYPPADDHRRCTPPAPGRSAHPSTSPPSSGGASTAGRLLARHATVEPVARHAA